MRGGNMGAQQQRKSSVAGNCRLDPCDTRSVVNGGMSCEPAFGQFWWHGRAFMSTCKASGGLSAVGSSRSVL